jgi:mono/diheme cytochrome c family protein
MLSPGRALLSLAILTAPVGAQGPAPATPTPSSKNAGGAALFRTYCASCHGTNAKGHGPVADSLQFQPPDLTLIASRNHGKWDGGKVARIIDGREAVKGHGGTEMPVWGDALKTTSAGYDEKTVSGKVRALVDYIESLQATPAKD